MDLEDLFGVETSSVYKCCIWPVVYALDDLLDVHFDPHDVEELDRLSQGMYIRIKQIMPWCIGAVDGMAMKIERPSKACVLNPAAYRSQKRFFALNLQALASYKRRFIWWSSKCCGNTHDSLQLLGILRGWACI